MSEGRGAGETDARRICRSCAFCLSLSDNRGFISHPSLIVVGIRIRVVLHICHHPVIQHHIEKYSAFSAKNPPHKQRIRYPQAAKRIFRAADKQIPVHNPVKQPPAPGDAAAFAGRRNGKAEGLARPALHGGAEGFRLDCDIGSVQMEPQAPRPPHLHPNARTYIK